MLCRLDTLEHITSYTKKSLKNKLRREKMTKSISLINFIFKNLRKTTFKS